MGKIANVKSRAKKAQGESEYTITPITLIKGTGPKLSSAIEAPKHQLRLRSGLNAAIYGFDPTKLT